MIWTAGLAGADEADAAQLDRPVDRRAHRLPDPIRDRRTARHPGLHHPAGHAVRRDLHGVAPEHELVDGLVAGAWPAGTPEAWTGGHADPGDGGRGLPRVRARARPTSSGRPTRRRRPASSSVRTRPTRHRRARSRSSSPTTCWPATAPARSWRCPARTSGTGRSPRPSTCRSSVPSQPADGFDGKAYTGDGPAINSSNPAAGSTWTAWASPTPRRASSNGWSSDGYGAGRDHLPAAGLAVQPAAVLGRAVPDRLRRDRPAGGAARVDAAGRAARTWTTSRRRRTTVDDATSEPETPLSRATDWVNGRAGPGRRARPCARSPGRRT